MPVDIAKGARKDHAREFAYTRDDFDKVRELIHAHAGIRLNDTKVEMVYGRLVRRLRALHLTSFSSYIEMLENKDDPEWEPFVNALTTNQTAFFREAHHFPVLAEFLRGVPPGEKTTLWSAAASTGEEAYSMAITACEVHGSFAPRVKILATDLDSQVLAQASEGIYTLEQLEDLSPERLRRFFLKGTGARAGLAKVKPELRALVSFGKHNLRDEDWRFSEGFDCIFCRNVMIYFDKSTQYQVLTRMARVLSPNGLLFAGHAESYYHAADLFRLCGRTVYCHAGHGKAPVAVPATRSRSVSDADAG
jgi:chemotaxis protein methyltransferase CheR